MAVRTKIKKGDTIEVISGREADRGQRGEVVRVMPKEGRVVVQGLNMRKKHQRQVQTQGRTLNPGIIEFEGPMHISNVQLVCPKCGKASRISITRDDDGVAHRVCKACDEQID
jgi:large subunit ribosomal protein L24